MPDFSDKLLGIPKEYFIEGMDPEVSSAVHQTIRTCFLLYATRKFIRDRNPVKIFVMAHTHIPYLAMVRLTAGFPREDEEA